MRAAVTMPLYRVHAIVLRRMDLGETDRVLRLLTREAGRLSAIAKGARRPTSRFAGATEPFTASRMLLATGKTFQIVSQCEMDQAFPNLRQDLEGIARAAYLCELVERLTDEQEPLPVLFDLLMETLKLLDAARMDRDAVVHMFELKLLAERGYEPQVSRCVECGASVEGSGLGFSASMGGALCRRHRYGAQDAVPIRATTLHCMAEMLALAPDPACGLQLPPETLKDLERCLRSYIAWHTEPTLRTAEFLQILRSAP
ncbi:MAG: DNA repair protein RecO [Chthonomonadales bacterium]